MKAKHLLAALALPAIFSACTQDELVTNDVNKEVVGTPIGYDLNFIVPFSDPTTRVSLGGNWEEDDKIGMGWISDGIKLAAADDKIYSNHPIYYKSASGQFKSETMIYEGLYIASFPYQKSVQSVGPLEFDLQNQVSEKSYHSDRVRVSEKFIDLRGDDAGLAHGVSFNMTLLTNLMQLNIKLPEGANVPSDFKVTGVTLTDTGNKLVNKLKLANTNAAVAKDNSTLAIGCWNPAKGNINVQVGEKGVGSAIDATDGLNVYVQMGMFASDDATTVKVHTNYGDLDIKSGAAADVTWSSKALGQKDLAEVSTFTLAIQGMQSKVTAGSEYGKNVAVNVTLDMASLNVPTDVSNQADLDKIVSMYEAMGKLGAKNSQTATINFKNTKENKGNVIITDFSGLNKFGGVITFTKDATNVYVSGEIALQADPTVTSVNLTIPEGQTLTVSKALNWGSNTITVAAGATLINQAAITATTVTTADGSEAVGNTPAVPAGLYISETGASVTGTFTNSGATEWKGGTLPSMTGALYANVKTALDMMGASAAFAAATGADSEIIIANDLTVATQLSKTPLPNIKSMTVKGNVTFGLGLAESFDFSDLTAIKVESGSFNLTGGDQGKTGFYAFKTSTSGCNLDLAAGTELNVAAGAKLDLASAGTVTYSNATITNNGYIVAQSASGSGTWSGTAVNVDPKSK